MLAKDIKQTHTKLELILKLTNRIEQLEYENRMLENRVSELEKHVFTF